MRRKTIGLGILLGVATLAVTGAAAAVLPSVLGADTPPLVDVAGIAAPAPQEAATHGAPSAARRGGSAGKSGARFQPGYRRVSRKRVQPKKPADNVLKCFSGLIQIASQSFEVNKLSYTISFGTAVNDKPIQLRFYTEERIKGATELRKLSVEDRLARAKELLGLTSGQLELLQRAAAEREAAKNTGEDDGEGDAVATFEHRVTEALNDDQRRRWTAQGYGDSFGNPLPIIISGSNARVGLFVADVKPIVVERDVVITTYDPGICHQEKP